MGMHVHTLQGVVDVMIIVPVPTYNEKHGGKAIFNPFTPKTKIKYNSPSPSKRNV